MITVAMPVQVPVAPSVLGLFDAVSLIASLASLILAVIAIWLTLAFKRDADDVNQNTRNLLIEVRTDSKAISQGVMTELRAYGESMRSALLPVAHNRVANPTGGSGEVGLTQKSPEPTQPDGPQGNT